MWVIILAILGFVMGFGLFMFLPKPIMKIMVLLAEIVIVGAILATIGYGQLIGFLQGMSGLLVAFLAGLALGGTIKDLF